MPKVGLLKLQMEKAKYFKLAPEICQLMQLTDMLMGQQYATSPSMQPFVISLDFLVKGFESHWGIRGINTIDYLN